ncbi:unnamed protein product [Aphanomyces euteiches]|uniref:PX domain-containing protein n=1 Tax=Aphanomyces euteiches TaxID=100861 RepID=A0A6G0XQH0_9STRA|nr:hypothetical protein Ae201684_002624 [Aphanomyces euteiches]KAH9092527.1 hypothetical protein Ae201684P_008202 [Aphanomyces euteiches]KAH9152704.1 hypothetical protein AeRB84_004934 [Aphanomyces euteiches]
MGCAQSSVAQTIEIANDENPVEEPQPVHCYTITGHSVDDTTGVVFYHVEADGVVAKKRFNDFKTFHRDIQLLPDIPSMPAAGFRTALQRQSPQLIEERRARFQEMLDAAPQDRVAIFLDPNAFGVLASDIDQENLNASQLTANTNRSAT